MIIFEHTTKKNRGPSSDRKKSGPRQPVEKKFYGIFKKEVHMDKA